MNKNLILVFVALIAFSYPCFGQKVGVKSNLLYDATTTINLGVEFGISKSWTLDVSGNYNPWNFSDNKKMKGWFVQPEFRWWTCNKFSGHFLGAHVLGGEYNWNGMYPFGIKPNLKYRYQGWGAGAGISYGYHFMLGGRWGLEATLGVGYIHFNYNKYDCPKCGESLGKGKKNYFGPTKAGLTLVYMIK